MKRILSIDGGGIRGLLPATLLAEIERREMAKAGALFDLVAGTSTGGIIASALASGRCATEMVSLYQDHGPKIFKRTLLRRCGIAFGAKYAALNLETQLKAKFGETWLSQIRGPELLVPTYVTKLPVPIDVDSDGVAECASSYFFKSWKARDFKGNDFKLRDIARATSAAPTYFPAAQIYNHKFETFTCIDGGVFANNPMLCAIAAARQLWPSEDFSVLSLGTGSRVKAVQSGDWGVAQWLPNIFAAFMDGSADTVTYVSRELFGSRIKRCEIAVPSEMDDAFDNVKPVQMKALTALAAAYTAKFIGTV